MGAIALVQAFGENEGGGGNERGSSSQAVEAPSHLQAEKDPLLRISVMYMHMIRDACRRSAVRILMLQTFRIIHAGQPMSNILYLY